MLKTKCAYLAPLANSEKYTFWLEGSRRSDHATVFCCLDVPGITEFLLGKGFVDEGVPYSSGVIGVYSIGSPILGFVVVQVVESVVVRTKTKQLMKLIEDCSEEEHLFNDLYDFKMNKLPPEE